MYKEECNDDAAFMNNDRGKGSPGARAVCLSMKLLQKTKTKRDKKRGRGDLAE
jgi:hypothetical protein